MVNDGMRDALQLIRKDDTDTLFCTAAAAAGKVVISKLSWPVPIVQLYKIIAANNAIPVEFVMRQCETVFPPKARSTEWLFRVHSAPEKPRWVLLGLQTGRIHNQENNAAIFEYASMAESFYILFCGNGYRFHQEADC